MTNSELPDSVRSLLVAARREAPTSLVRDRVLDEMLEVHRERPRGFCVGVWGTALGLGAAAAVSLWALSSQLEAETPIVAEPSVVSPATEVTTRRLEVPPVEALAPNPRPRPMAETSPPLQHEMGGHAAPVGSAPSLAKEVEALDAVREAIDAGNAPQALELLQAYEQWPGRVLTVEANVLRIEALSNAGKRAEASQLAREFVARHPSSPLVDRARRYLTTESAPQPSGPDERSASERGDSAPKREQ